MNILTLFLADQIKTCNGDLLKICQVLYKIFPVLHRPVQHQLIAKEEMKFFKQHGVNHVWPVPNLIVPKLKNLDEHYRIGFDQDDNEFNKQVEKELKKPDDLFGATTGDEEEPASPPPTKKTKVIIPY